MLARKIGIKELQRLLTGLEMEEPSNAYEDIFPVNIRIKKYPMCEEFYRRANESSLRMRLILTNKGRRND